MGKQSETKQASIRDKSAQISELLPKLRQYAEQLESQTVDLDFVQNKVLQGKSGVADTILAYHCKEKALEDCITGLRQSNLPLSETLKIVRALSKKQFKLQSKIAKLQAYHSQNQ